MQHLTLAHRFTRRSLLTGMATLPLTLETMHVGNKAIAEELSRLVIREREPQNFESDFSSLKSFLTPNDAFYVRNHFAIPFQAANTWRLRVEGAVKRPFEMSYDELTRLPSETKSSILECAGNGRVLLVPKVDGAQWQLGAVGNAEWTGVLLSRLLERAGVESKAAEVILEGADSGDVTKPSRPSKPFHYARSVPIKTVSDSAVLLAYRMNGQPLPASHGFPVRAIVPGWYGMASVKWLERIVITTTPYKGYFQTVDYAYWQHHNGLPSRVAITELQVKAQIARPTFDEIVPKGTRYRVFGAAWTGDATISKVEISTDGGKRYSAAKLLGDPVRHSWRLWEFTWDIPSAPGKYALIAKATDSQGNTQPVDRDKDRETYMINHLVPTEVNVR